MSWLPIESAPKVKHPMIVVRGVLASGYITDPWCVWWEEGGWQRWPHKEPPPLWCALPEMETDDRWELTEAGRAMRGGK